jgi:hypothetical protein
MKYLIILIIFSFTQLNAQRYYSDERMEMESQQDDYGRHYSGGKADWDKIMMMLGIGGLIAWWFFKPKQKNSKILTTDVDK